MIVSDREIQEFCDRLVKEFNPDKVILFGSYARGEQREWSDVDIMVVMPHEGNGIDESVRIRTRVRPDFPLDLLTYRLEDLERRYREHDPFVGHALDTGKVLYERHN